MWLSGALADPSSAGDPLQTALVAVCAGVLFGGIGTVLVTNFRGLAHRWVKANDDSLEQIPLTSKPLRRFNVRVFFAGDAAQFAEHKLNVMPKIVGSGFVLMGAVAFIAGIVRLIQLA